MTLTAWDKPTLTREPSRTTRTERFDATSLQYRPRRLLAFPRRRWLGDREPHRALRADGDVSIFHRAHLARRRLRLQRSRRRSGEADARDVAGGRSGSEYPGNS